MNKYVVYFGDDSTSVLAPDPTTAEAIAKIQLTNIPDDAEADRIALVERG